MFERRVFQDNGDGTQSFGRIDCYRRGAFILEAKQGNAAGVAELSDGTVPLEKSLQTLLDLSCSGRAS